MFQVVIKPLITVVSEDKKNEKDLVRTNVQKYAVAV